MHVGERRRAYPCRRTGRVLQATVAAFTFVLTLASAANVAVAKYPDSTAQQRRNSFQDSIAVAVVRPVEVRLPYIQGEFVSGSVRVLNRGNKVMTLKEVLPSCFCASASSDRDKIAPLGAATIRFAINTAKMFDSLMRVDFEIKGNMPGGSISFPVYLYSVKRNKP